MCSNQTGGSLGVFFDKVVLHGDVTSLEVQDYAQCLGLYGQGENSVSVLLLMESNVHRIMTVDFQDESAEYYDANASILGATDFDNTKTTLFGLISSTQIFVHGTTSELGSASFAYQIAYVANLQDSTRASQFWSTTAQRATISTSSNQQTDIASSLTETTDDFEEISYETLRSHDVVNSILETNEWYHELPECDYVDISGT